MNVLLPSKEQTGLRVNQRYSCRDGSLKKCDIYCESARLLGDGMYDLTGSNEAAAVTEEIADPILRVVGELAKDWLKAQFQRWLNEQSSKATIQSFGYYPVYQPQITIF
jgi:hypothetical protein